MKNKRLITSLFISLLTLPQLVFAHFHYELGLTAHLQANQKQQLNAIKITMTYGEEVSKLMLQDAKNINTLGEQLIADLDKLGYFTVLKLNNTYLETAKVEAYQLAEIKQDGHSKLRLNLLLPLKTPVSLKGNNILELKHEDVNASAIIFYKDTDAIRIDDNLHKNCTVNIKEKETFEEGESPQVIKVICKASVK